MLTGSADLGQELPLALRKIARPVTPCAATSRSTRSKFIVANQTNSGGIPRVRAHVIRREERYERTLT